MTFKCFTTKISLCSRSLFRHTFGVHGVYIINYLLFMFFSPLQDMHYCVLDIPWVLWEGNAYIKLIILSFINTGGYVVGFYHDRLLIYDQPQHSYDCGHLSEWNGSAEANLGWLSSPKLCSHLITQSLCFIYWKVI